MIKYLGSKRVLLPRILRMAEHLPEVETVLDLFSGTSRVGHAFKKQNKIVTANDHMSYAYKLAQCYVVANKSTVEADAKRIIEELNALPGSPGYFTETFCEKAMFFQPKNGARVDAMRERIASMGLDPILEAVVLVSLMEAADRVDSTCGLQMAYLKSWATRAKENIQLRMPDILPGTGYALQMDAKEAAAASMYDLVYIDPPYNQHKYMGNYHIWESLIKWDKPEVYGKAMKRVDARTYKSGFNSKRHIADSFKEVLNNVQAKYMMVSFSNEGHLKHPDLVTLLSAYGETAWFEVPYRRYVGAQIGIYNQNGDKVGAKGHLYNKEYIFLVGRNATEIIDKYTKEVSSES
jgi:adenine-specific DNA-methyltransferase